MTECEHDWYDTTCLEDKGIPSYRCVRCQAAFHSPTVRDVPEKDRTRIYNLYQTSEVFRKCVDDNRAGLEQAAKQNRRLRLLLFPLLSPLLCIGWLCDRWGKYQVTREKMAAHDQLGTDYERRGAGGLKGTNRGRVEPND